jgi:hypothetical protein
LPNSGHEPPKHLMAMNARRRQIGAIGTAARAVLGLVFLLLGVTAAHVSVIHGPVRSGFDPLSVAIGLVGFPAVVLVWQWLRARIAPTRLQATGPVSTAYGAGGVDLAQHGRDRIISVAIWGPDAQSQRVRPRLAAAAGTWIPG